MLDTISAQLGSNLASIAKDRGVSFAPIQNTLLEQLCTSMTAKLAALPPVQIIEHVPMTLLAAACGDHSDASGSTVYHHSSHDTVMDNYVKDLANLVGQHVVFARSVVYPQMKAYAETVGVTARAGKVSAPEDMFELTYWKLHEIFTSDLVLEEVVPAYGDRTRADYLELGQSLQTDTLCNFLLTGDASQDKLISAWCNDTCQSDAGALASYLMPSSANLEFRLDGKALMDFHLAGFLFYRHLVINQDLNLPYSQVELLGRAKANRDYHASQLAAQLRRFEGDVNRGVLIAEHPAEDFSYLSNTPLKVVLYQEVFDAACEQGVTLEQIFGCFASGASGGLTVSDLKNMGDQWATQWSKTRSLYLAYMQQNSSQTLRSALKLSVSTVLDAQQPVEGEVPACGDAAFRAQTTELVAVYVDALEDDQLQDLVHVSLQVIARIAYRHTNAYALLREMLRFVQEEEDLSMSDAAALSVLCYVCDFIFEQAMVRKD